MKGAVRAMLPGCIVDVLRRRAINGPRFSDHSSALAACPPGAYEDDELVRVIVAKNLRLREELAASRRTDLQALRAVAALALAATHAGPDGLRVLDFGGGAGSHYTIARRLLGEQAALRWAVVDTPAMVRAAAPMRDGALEFFDQISAAAAALGRVDLVFTSSALHYCPEPLRTLQELVDIGAPRLAITRTGFATGAESLIGVQRSRLSSNGPGRLPPGVADRDVFYPRVFVPLATVLQILERPYNIRLRVDEEREAYRVGGVPIGLYGLFCSRR